MSSPRNSDAQTRLKRTVQKYFSVKSLFTSDDRKVRFNWWQMLCLMALAAMVSWLMDLAGRFDLARPVLAILCSLVVVLRLRWRLRNRVWFWATLLVFLALACFVTTAVSWSTRGPSYPLIAGFAGICIYCLFVTLHAFEIRNRQSSKTSPERPEAANDQRQPR